MVNSFDLPGVEILYVVADREIKLIRHETEWMLNENILNSTCKTSEYFKPHIDLFASRLI